MMKRLTIDLVNCYGIHALQYEFDFNNQKRANAYSIYAPNGLMKTSFSRTFEKIANGEKPTEERYNRPTTCSVLVDEEIIDKNDIYVLKSEIDISAESPAITNILVNPECKQRYDNILNDLEKLKIKVIGSLNKHSGVTKNLLEQTLINDLDEKDFPTCITKALQTQNHDDLSPFKYITIFDPKTIEVLKSDEFIAKANEFSQRYQEVFEQSGSIYKKGVFNPIKAEMSFGTLEKQGFFASGHKIHFEGESNSIDKKELDEKLKEINANIDSDDTLKKLRSNLSKNAQTQSLVALIETLPPTEVEYLLNKLTPDNINQFKKELWYFYIKDNTDALEYVSNYQQSKDEIDSIEAEAARLAPKWSSAVEKFNSRFVDMPFTLSIENNANAALGREKAKLKFIFRDGDSRVECLRHEIKNLSQGEKRALYLLNFIFEVEDRKQKSQKTLFIIDDVADSFDYKNKHAIIQYLEDLNKTPYFYQLILTHNFDFFRTLANNFVHYERCLMTSRNKNSLTLTKAEGIKNYFIGKWKNNINHSEQILCATIPFTRNIIEYTKGEADQDYLNLTSLLHWKPATDKITVGDYYRIYNKTFNTQNSENDSRSLKEILFNTADIISRRTQHDGLNLEDKVLLSIAIRMRAEIYLTTEIRKLKNAPDYWCEKNNQFGNLVKEFSELIPDKENAELNIIEKISITVSSNIHLNSFMYEPILDLTIEHLIHLYNEVKNLGQQPMIQN